MNYLFKEVNLNEKKDKIIEIYKNLVLKNNYRCRDILFIVPNGITKLNYLRSINLKCSEELKISTYSHFVQKELIRYWPLIVDKCDLIKERKISPTFISSSLSEYILMSYIHEKRNYDNYFEDIVGTDRSICRSILDNLSKASYNNLDLYWVGDKIYESKKNKDKLTRFSYSQMQESIEYYMNTLLSKGIEDNSLSIYLYNNYLLKNEAYINRLQKEYKYLIVDSLENASVSEANLFSELLSIVKDSYVFYDNSKDYSSFKNVDITYVEENIIKKFFNEDSNILRRINLYDLYNENKIVELEESPHLYNEMIDMAMDKVIDLVKDGENTKDIVIISPVNNYLLDYKIQNILKENNIDVVNTKIDNKVIDHPYANALVVATAIFYNLQDLIKEEEFINFIEIIFNINRIKAVKIFNNRHNDEEYDNLVKYIKNKSENHIKISEFLIQFYIEKMLNLKYGKESIVSCKDIIKQSEVFDEILERLKIEDEKTKGKIFISCLKENINDYYMSADIEDMKNSNAVMITTPYSYISSDIHRKTQIWLDIGSNAWNMKIEKDIANPLVLRKSFEEKEIYTDDMEERYKKYYIYNLIYNLLINSEKVYAYKSEYSVNGFMQESILYSLLLKLLDKGDNDNDED